MIRKVKEKTSATNSQIAPKETTMENPAPAPAQIASRNETALRKDRPIPEALSRGKPRYP